MLKPENQWFTFDGKPIPLTVEYGYRLLTTVQDILMWLGRFFRPLFFWFFSSDNVSIYIIYRTKDGDYEGKSVDDFFNHLKELIQRAKEIKIALGEMGKGLVDRKEVIDGFKWVYENNRVVSTIVCGPRVDIKTERIFELAKEGIVEIYRMSDYRSHHFMLITSDTDEVTVISEGVHDETLWAKNKDGDVEEVYATRNRIPSIVKKAKHLSEDLSDEFDRRKKGGELIFYHPQEQAFIDFPQDYSPIRTFSHAIRNTPIRYLFQPFTLKRDLSLDSPLNFLRYIRYTRESMTQKEIEQPEAGMTTEELRDLLSRPDWRELLQNRETLAAASAALNVELDKMFQERGLPLPEERESTPPPRVPFGKRRTPEEMQQLDEEYQRRLKKY